VTSNAPAAVRSQHVEAIEPPRVDASAFRQGWRVRTRLDALLVDGSITPAQWTAADQYRALWGRVFGLATPLDATRGSGRGAGGPDARAVALLDLSAQVFAVERAIGPLATRLTTLCVIEDRSWAEIGRLTARHPQTARTWCVLAIRAVAAHWTSLQGGAGSRRSIGAARRTAGL
jgi:hypothetical protein